MIIKLITELFSMNPKNMRFPYLKRLLMVLIMVPFFTFLFVVNNFFLMMDYIFFFSFKRIKINQPVFIVSMPRTGTTMLFHFLSSLKEEFTSMKLWELIFAPSIIQKLVILNFIRIDSKMNLGVKKLAIFLSNLIFKKLVSLHNTGLEQPEEDELVLLWNLSSPYLQYFYPESNVFDQLLNLDKQLDSKKQNKIMNQYLRHVQRHNYVFNRNGKKKFLSKNPFMMGKIKSLYFHFKDAKILTINRCPNRIINSTINLNELLFSTFSSVAMKEELKLKIETIIKDWFFHTHKIFSENKDLKHHYLDFELLIKKEEKHYKSLFQFLELNLKYINQILNTNHMKFKSKPKSSYKLKKYLDPDDIPFMRKYYKKII